MSRVEDATIQRKVWLFQTIISIKLFSSAILVQGKYWFMGNKFAYRCHNQHEICDRRSQSPRTCLDMVCCRDRSLYSQTLSEVSCLYVESSPESPSQNPEEHRGEDGVRSGVSPRKVASGAPFSWRCAPVRSQMVCALALWSTDDSQRLVQI